MKIPSLSDVLAFLLLAALLAWGWWSISESEREAQVLIDDCVLQPSYESCKRCADLPGKRYDTCRPIFAGLVLEQRRQGR